MIIESIPRTNDVREVDRWRDSVGIKINDYAFIKNILADYTITMNDSILLCDSTGGDITITLLPAAKLIYKKITVKKTVAANNVIIDGDGSETIDGAATKTISNQWESLTIISDGSNWYIIGELD